HLCHLYDHGRRVNEVCGACNHRTSYPSDWGVLCLQCIGNRHDSKNRMHQWAQRKTAVERTRKKKATATADDTFEGVDGIETSTGILRNHGDRKLLHERQFCRSQLAKPSPPLILYYASGRQAHLPSPHRLCNML